MSAGSHFCQARTMRGRQCQRRALAGQTFCHQHAEIDAIVQRQRQQSQPPPPTARPLLLPPPSLPTSRLPVNRFKTCSFPDWVNIPDPRTGTVAPYNSPQGRLNLQATWAALHEEKERYGWYSLRSLFEHLPPTRRTNGLTYHRNTAFLMVVAHLFTHLSINCQPNVMSIRTVVTDNHAGVDLEGSVRAQKEEFSFLRNQLAAQGLLRAQESRKQQNAARRQQLFNDRSRDFELVKRDLDQLSAEEKQQFEDYLHQRYERQHPYDPQYFQHVLRRCDHEVILLPHSLVVRDEKKPSIFRGFHANVLVVDQKNHRVYNFEPHGFREWTEAVEAHIVTYIMPHVLGLDRQYQFVSTTQICPSRRGPQTLDPYDTGFCAAWSYWFNTTLLINPDLTPEFVVQELSRSPTLNADVRRFVSLMEHMIAWPEEGDTARYIEESQALECALTEQHSSVERVRAL